MNALPAGKLWLTAALAVWALGQYARAAEICFRAECQVSGPLVRLGDLADIYDDDADQARRLAEIDLMPAPPAAQRRVVRAREIQDLLHLRGIQATGHRFSGASQVTIAPRGEATRPNAPAPVRLNVPLQEVTKRVRETIAAYIAQQTGQAEWLIEFELELETAQRVAPAGESLQVAGGTDPWTGLQHLTLYYSGVDERIEVPLSVQVVAPPMVVVATQPIARGSMVRASDVRLQPGRAAEGAVRVYQSLDEAIGKEATKNIAIGQILDDRSARPPLLVRRSEIVSVYARSSGLRVRTTARALEAGSENDLVRVETLADRKSFLARVSGPQEVEVYAQAPIAVSDPGPAASAAATRYASSERRLPPAPLPSDMGPAARK